MKSWPAGAAEGATEVVAGGLLPRQRGGAGGSGPRPDATHGLRGHQSISWVAIRSCLRPSLIALWGPLYLCWTGAIRSYDLPTLHDHVYNLGYRNHHLLHRFCYFYGLLHYHSTREPQGNSCSTFAIPLHLSFSFLQVIGIILAIASGVLIGSSFVFKKKGLLRSQKGAVAGEGVAYLKSVCSYFACFALRSLKFG